MLDIGAGHGALTRHLVAAGARVLAIEPHPARAARLRASFAGQPVTVLEITAEELSLPARPFRVVANPPFAISTAVMRQLLAEVEPETAQHLQAALDALLMNCLVQWTTGRQTMAESAARLDAVARLILAPRCPAEPHA